MRIPVCLRTCDFGSHRFDQTFFKSLFDMDPSGFEPEASALQGQRSTRLSYGPGYIYDYKKKRAAKQFQCWKKNNKEVIHPQVPLRIPCDDLSHLAELRFGTFTQCGSPKPCSVGLTGGVCKAQGHIHQNMLNSDY